MLFLNEICRSYQIDNGLTKLSEKCLGEVKSVYEKIDDVAACNQLKVLSAMQKNKLSESHFAAATGYGYGDSGRDALEKIYADVFHTEDALVRTQIVSGTHALAVALFGNLKAGDELLSAAGKPYSTLEGVIGIRKTEGSLMAHGVTYKQVELTEDNKIDFTGLEQSINPHTKVVLIQRSKGYAWRPSLSVEEIKDVIEFVKSIKKDAICMVDNCYGEFVDTIEPSDVGADMVVGSLIKNPGGGLATIGGYIAGRADCIERASYRLTAPGLGKEVGPSLGLTSGIAHGLFIAPSVVASSLKGAVFAARLFEELGFGVLPKFNEKRSDIVQALTLGSRERLSAFCRGIQKASPVDSFVEPTPWDMPGYDCDVIMACGSFVSGASIELSADAPFIEPYVAYLQGGLTAAHSIAGVVIAANEMLKLEKI